jgi:hypothetical protein
MKLPALSIAVLVTMTMTAAAFAESLDFEVYRTRVEPIFLKRREGHARCVTCHATNSSAFHLQPLADGQTAWTVEQSRQNFESISHLVTPGNPSTSHFLLHPLAPEAGGEEFHGGGRQFESKDDPDWKIMAAWVAAAK